MPSSRSTTSRSAAQRRRAQAMARQTSYAKAALPTMAEPAFEDDDWDASPATPRWPAVAGLVICVVGLADAAYLTYAHYTTAAVLACSTKGFIDCAAVTTSRYSHIFGVPVAVLGLVYFAFMTPLMLPVAWRSRNRWIRALRLAASVVGVGLVVWLVYVELIKLNAICEYCTGVHILTFGLFVVIALGTIATADPA
jgi:uncharacterized membrane protein